MREERIEKAFFGEHHGPGDDAKAMLLRAPSHVNIDVVEVKHRGASCYQRAFSRYVYITYFLSYTGNLSASKSYTKSYKYLAFEPPS